VNISRDVGYGLRAMARPVPDRIENGTFAGECLIDCFETVAVTPITATYSLTSRFPDAAHPDIRVDEPMDAERWNSLVGLTDVGALGALPRRIELPDGADLGGEFLAVSAGGAVTRVDFEAGATPAPLGPALGELRALRAALGERHGRGRHQP
jgi:hypothetical protein